MARPNKYRDGRVIATSVGIPAQLLERIQAAVGPGGAVSSWLVEAARQRLEREGGSDGEDSTTKEPAG